MEIKRPGSQPERLDQLNFAIGAGKQSLRTLHPGLAGAFIMIGQVAAVNIAKTAAACQPGVCRLAGSNQNLIRLWLEIVRLILSAGF